MDSAEQTAIKTHSITIVPRYCETDRGGVVHHSVYPVWFEMGRTELLRVNGIAYKDMETAGVFFVVVELSIKYRHPAGYDEDLELETTQTKITAAKIENKYKLIRRIDKKILAEGSSVLACLNEKGSVSRIPNWFPLRD